MYNLPAVSIIIPERNEEKHLEQCITSVFNLNYPSNLIEVIVVDNGSIDNSTEIVTQLFNKHGSGVMLSKVGGTIASVRNFGWRHAQGDVLAFLDGDSVVDPDWLLTGVNLLLAKDDISCVGFAVSPPSCDDTWVERAWYQICSSSKHSGTKQVGWLSSFNLILRSDYFAEIGGFDESLVTCEDVDLGNRLSSISKLIFSDECYVKHLGNVKSLHEFIVKEFWRGKNSFSSFKKSDGCLKETLSVLIPTVYVFVFTLTVLLCSAILFKQISIVLIFILIAFVAGTPMLLAMRAGVRNIAAIFPTTILYMFYLLARGASIVYNIR